MRSKSRLSIAGVALVLGAVLCLATVGLVRVLSTRPVREIPSGKAKRIFKMITANALPESVEDLRAVFWDSRDPAIFVRFKTNAAGIAYITGVFGGPHAESYMLDEDALRKQETAGWRPFWKLQDAEEKWGIPRLFDMESFTSALWLTKAVGSEPGSHADFRECHILIDTENSIVYMWAMYMEGEN